MSGQYKHGRGDLVERSRGDLSESLEMCCKAFEWTNGTMAKYPPDDEGFIMFRDRAKKYFEDLYEYNKCDDPNKYSVIADVEGFCVYMGISRQLLSKYRSRGGRWTELIDYVRTLIAMNKKQLGLSGKIPAVAFVFDMTNNHDYYNTSEFRMSAVENNNTIIDRSRTKEEIMSSLSQELLSESEDE